MKNGVLCDVTPCDSCKNRRFWGIYCLHHQSDKNRWNRNVSRNYQPKHAAKYYTFFAACVGCYLWLTFLVHRFSSDLEPITFRLLAYGLKHYATVYPILSCFWKWIMLIFYHEEIIFYVTELSEINDRKGSAALTTRHPSIHKSWH
jgi:hypothetical protein